MICYGSQTTHLLRVLRLRMHGSLPPLPHTSSWHGSDRTILPLPPFYSVVPCHEQIVVGELIINCELSTFVGIDHVSIIMCLKVKVR